MKKVLMALLLGSATLYNVSAQAEPVSDLQIQQYLAGQTWVLNSIEDKIDMQALRQQEEAECNTNAQDLASQTEQAFQAQLACLDRVWGDTTVSDAQWEAERDGALLPEQMTLQVDGRVAYPEEANLPAELAQQLPQMHWQFNAVTQMLTLNSQEGGKQLSDSFKVLQLDHQRLVLEEKHPEGTSKLIFGKS